MYRELTSDPGFRSDVMFSNSTSLTDSDVNR